MTDDDFPITRHEWDLLLQRVAKLEAAAAQAQHTTEIAVADEGKKIAKPKRGTRLPDGWVPDQPTIDKMAAELHVYPEALAREHRKFCDYYFSAPGQRGVKLAWDRTWCNWMRNASERGSLGGTPVRRTNADKSREWLEMGNAESQ